jgi:class 3 adenylate cyclase
MASTRRLTAILAADVAGYSRLMGGDEEGTHQRLQAHFRQLVDPKIEEHRGRIVKNTGDGLLVEFASVVDAVRCAAEVQRGMLDREPMVSDERRIRFRIGVNLGDVIAEGGDIFGDGVNVAARLESLAEPGGICISRTVREQIRGKLLYPFDDMGEQSVKNIARPVRVYALRPAAVADLPASSAQPAVSMLPPTVAPRLSIVVLPFANLSSDAEQQYFADDSNLVARPADASVQHIAYTKLAADLLRVDGLVPVGERGIARDHEHAREPRQVGRQRAADRCRDRRPSVGRAVRQRYGRSVRLAKRDHQPDRVRARPHDGRHGGRSTDRESGRSGLPSPGTRRRCEAAIT